MDELFGKLPATLIEFIQRPREEWDQIDLKDADEADSAARAIGALMGEISGYIIPYVATMNSDKEFARKNSEKRRKAVRKAMGYSYP